MTSQHPITPPPELVRQWMERTEYDEHTWFYECYIAEQAAQWGADMELEACCDWLKAKHWIEPEFADELRAARRPNPPSLKEQALDVLQRISKDKYPCNYQEDSDWDTIRRALDALPE